MREEQLTEMNVIAEATPGWEVADGLSDRIVREVNASLDAMRAAGNVDGLQLLAGQLLALLSLGETMKHIEPMPPALRDVMQAAERCVREMLRAADIDRPRAEITVEEVVR